MKIKRFAIISFVLILFLGLGLVIYRVVSGQSLGLREKLARIENIARSVIGHSSIVSINNGEYTNVIFIHHSVGQNIITQGNLREQLSKLGYSFYDQDYMYIGLTAPDGKPTGYSYDIPGDNTDIDGYARIFQQLEYGLPINALSALLQHEVIIFKSCFPNSNIIDDAMLELRKQEYISIRSRIGQYPDHIFILMTSPPLNPTETTPDAAYRAKALSDWLVSPDFTDGHPNLFVFDLFNILIENDLHSNEYGMLQADYREGTDSHPNETANIRISSDLADFVNHRVAEYRDQVASSQP